ncbi:MAG: hypothetical protein B6I31_03695 [Desulfobacteraceae bacterium 4572_19]|nr:MAG: hypothetical protein B6I31_03695 [Desulfobacteraceae bacterium 4572_19]
MNSAIEPLQTVDLPQSVNLSQRINSAQTEDLPPTSHSARTIEPAHYFLLAILFITMFSCYTMIKPYLNPIIFAFILSIVFFPIHEKIETLMKGKKNKAALLSCTLLTFVVVIPVVFILILVIQEGVRSFTSMYDWFAAGNIEGVLKMPFVVKIKTFFESYLPEFQKLFPDFDIKSLELRTTLLKYSSMAGQKLISQSGNIIGNISALILSFFLMIFVFFFVVRDYKKIFKTIFHLIPLSTSYEKKILNKIKDVSKSVILGTLVTAVAQGVAGGIAFWIVGIPAFFWGTIIAFASLIPLVGTAIIWVPAAIYLFISGHWGHGIFLCLWCIIIVGMIDNIVRPLFMQGAANMSTVLIFFALLGGLKQFGLIGLLYGPLIFGLAIVLLYLYNQEFDSFLNHQDKS